MGNDNWSMDKVATLKNKIVVITGGNTGLGFESAKACAAKEAEVIIACRNTEKGELARLKILEQFPTAIITLMELDLESLHSINSFVAIFKSNYSRLDILLNNAGIMMVPFGLTKDGFEKQLGVNHLGHFALTGGLLELLKRTPKSRVVNVSSSAHKRGSMDFDNLLFLDDSIYTPFKAYCKSKLANLLFTYELQRYFEQNQIDCKAVAAHPGVANTNLFQPLESKWYFKLVKPLFQWVIQSPEMGALPQLMAALGEEVKGGEFYGPSNRNETVGAPKRTTSSDRSYNREDALQLWEISEKLTGVYFPKV